MEQVKDTRKARFEELGYPPRGATFRPITHNERPEQRVITTHRIDLQAPEKGHGKTLMSYLGQPIGASDSPIFAAARWLLANGMASPDGTVATYRGETLCMSGKAGVLAKWTVKERDKGGYR